MREIDGCFGQQIGIQHTGRDGARIETFGDSCFPLWFELLPVSGRFKIRCAGDIGAAYFTTDIVPQAVATDAHDVGRAPASRPVNASAMRLASEP
jgi:hypothetical protein